MEVYSWRSLLVCCQNARGNSTKMGLQMANLDQDYGKLSFSSTHRGEDVVVAHLTRVDETIDVRPKLLRIQGRECQQIPCQSIISNTRFIISNARFIIFSRPNSANCIGGNKKTAEAN